MRPLHRCSERKPSETEAESLDALPVPLSRFLPTPGNRAANGENDAQKDVPDGHEGEDELRNRHSRTQQTPAVPSARVAETTEHRHVLDQVERRRDEPAGGERGNRPQLPEIHEPGQGSASVLHGPLPRSALRPGDDGDRSVTCDGVLEHFVAARTISFVNYVANLLDDPSDYYDIAFPRLEAFLATWAR